MELDPARRHAVEVAYDEHAGDAYRVAYAILGDADLAVDVVQEAFARAFEHWGRYDPARPLRPWLWEIVANAARDAARRRRVRALTVVPMIGDEGDVPNGGTDAVDAVGDRLAVEAGLAALSRDARAAVVLRHYHGFSHEEIARILHVRTGTVSSLLSRAHATLRARLQDDRGGGDVTTNRGPRPDPASEASP